MLLLELMSPSELEESIYLLRRKLFKIAAIQGLSDKRAIEISKRLDLYLQRYNALKKQT